MQWFFFQGFPPGKVLHADQAALFLATPYKFPGYVSFIKPVVGSINRFLTRFVLFQCLVFGFNHFRNCGKRIFLNKNFYWLGRLPFFTRMRNKNFTAVWPLFYTGKSLLHIIRNLRIYWIAGRQLHGRREHLLQAHRSIFCQYIAKTSGSAWSNGRQWPVFRWEIISSRFVVSNSGCTGSKAQGI